MTPVTSLLTALERHDIAALNDLLDHEGITDEHFTCDEAAALWDAGWHAWLGGGRNGHASWHAGEAWDELRQEPWESDHDSWAAQSSLESPQLWHITLGMFLRVLHATFPALPGAPTWAALQDVEEE
jgi:hypothetical protein